MRKDDVSVTTYFELTSYRLCSDLVLKTGIPVGLFILEFVQNYSSRTAVQFSSVLVMRTRLNAGSSERRREVTRRDAV